MYAGQLVFAQLMDHLPWKTFGRIVETIDRISGLPSQHKARSQTQPARSSSRCHGGKPTTTHW